MFIISAVLKLNRSKHAKEHFPNIHMLSEILEANIKRRTQTIDATLKDMMLYFVRTNNFNRFGRVI